MTAISVQTDGDTFRFGTQSLKATTGDTGSNAIYQTDAMTVVPGEVYTFSAYVKTVQGTPITGGSIYLRIAQAGLLTPVLFESAAVTDSYVDEDNVDGFTRMVVTFTCPSGVTSVRPFIQYSGTTAGQTFWIDGIKFEEGDFASEWQVNVVSTKVVLDQGAVQIDAANGGLLRLRGSTGGARDTVDLATHGLRLGGDSEIYSPNAGEVKLLQTAGQDKTFTVETASAHLAALKVQVAGDTNARLGLRGDATLTGVQLGAGNAAADINAYRSAAKTLKIDTDAAGADLTKIDIKSVLTQLDGKLGFGLVSQQAGVATEGQSVWDDTQRGLVVGDSVRAKVVTPIGFALRGVTDGFPGNSAFGTGGALAAVSGGNGGAIAIPVNVPAPMLLAGYTVRNTDTASARAAEARLYYSKLDNSATIDYVTASAAAWSFTPSAASNRFAALTGGDILIPPGVYWLVIRNTSTTQAFDIGRDTGGVLAVPSTWTKSIASLGSTIDIVTGWASQANYWGAMLVGRLPDGTTAA